jgi:hypothetical protein
MMILKFLAGIGYVFGSLYLWIEHSVNSFYQESRTDFRRWKKARH